MNDREFLEPKVAHREPLVSISCLTYNHRNYIGAALDGILSQKVEFAFEILVHDDASTDGTAEIIKAYAERYPDIIVPVFQTENQFAKGVNPGVVNRSRAKGKYLAFCDGDDYWIDPLKLQKQVDCLEKNSDCGLVYTKVQRYFEVSGRFERHIFRGKERIPRSYEEFMMNTHFIAPSTWMVRRRILDQYAAEGLPKPEWIAGDFSMIVWIRKNYEIEYLDEATTVYRVLPTSLSHFVDPIKACRFYRSVLDIVRHYSGDDPDLYERVSAFHMRGYFPWICRYSTRNEIDAAYRHLGRHGLLNAKRHILYLLSFSKVTLAIYRVGKGILDRIRKQFVLFCR